MPKISVIVPVFRVAPYLRQCVDSILKQTYQELELILVDDGSPDTCSQICDEYVERDTRVKVIHKVNGGAGVTREAGLTQATGEYIMFLDGDDWLSPETCERSIASLKHKPDTDCLIFSYVREYPERGISAHVLDKSCVMEGREAEDRVYRRLFGLVGEELRNPERLESMGSCCMRLYRTERA